MARGISGWTFSRPTSFDSFVFQAPAIPSFTGSGTTGSSASSVFATSSGTGSTFAVVVNGSVVSASVTGNSSLFVNGEPVQASSPQHSSVVYDLF
jgi:hypothetical protein